MYLEIDIPDIGLILLDHPTYCDCTNGWSCSHLPLCFMVYTRLCCAQIWAGKMKLPLITEAIFNNAQVQKHLSYFNMADHLMNIQYVKKVLPPMTILCQLQTTGFISALRVSTPEILDHPSLKVVKIMSWRNKTSFPPSYNKDYFVSACDEVQNTVNGCL